MPGKSGGRLGRVQERSMACAWVWSTEKGEKLETKIAAVLGKWSVSSARFEQHCAQEMASISNGSSFLTSIAMKNTVSGCTNKEIL